MSEELLKIADGLLAVSEDILRRMEGFFCLWELR